MSEYTCALSFSKFKKRYGLTTSQVRWLERKGIVQIQQSGYLGDRLKHHKIVVYPFPFTLNWKICREMKIQTGKARRRIRFSKHKRYP